MKKYISAAVLVVFAMALPQARANSVIFNFAPSTASPTEPVSGTLGVSQAYNNSSGAGSYLVTAYGFNCANSSDTSTYCAGGNDATLSDLTHTTDLYGFTNTSTTVEGLGIASNTGVGQYSYDVPRTSFIQVDFSTMLTTKLPAGSTINDIIVDVGNINVGWNLFSSSTEGTLEAAGGQSLGNQGTNTSYEFLGSSLTTLLTEKYIGITAAVNCDVELTGLQVDYTPGSTVPEPGTCLLMGFALLGMGVAGKKLRRRS